jgi:hypothetical protein
MRDAPVISGVTDPSGRMVLPNRTVAEEITTATGHTLRPNPFGTINVVGANSNWLIEVSRPNGEFDHIQFVLPTLNEACWDGNSESWTFPIHSRLSSVALPRVATMSAAVEGNQVRLSWPAVPGVSSYSVYRASRYLNRVDDPSHEFENWRYRPLVTLADTSYVDVALYEASRYAVSPNSIGGAGPLSNRAFAPLLQWPRGVAVHPHGRRTVLDPQNGMSLRANAVTATLCPFFLFTRWYVAVSGDVDCASDWAASMANQRPWLRPALVIFP